MARRRPPPSSRQSPSGAAGPDKLPDSAKPADSIKLSNSPDLSGPAEIPAPVGLSSVSNAPVSPHPSRPPATSNASGGERTSPALRMHPPASPPDGRSEGRTRVVIEQVEPRVADGDFCVKRVVGEVVTVQADVFCDGHDLPAAVLKHRRVGATAWTEVRMQPLVNDRWSASFTVLAEGEHEFTIQAWVDHFGTWRRDLKRRAEAGQDLSIEFLIGAKLIAITTGGKNTSAQLIEFAARLRTSSPDRLELALDEQLAALAREHDARRHSTSLPAPVRVWVDRERARFSAWYELFPRSAGSDGQRHGTFRDVIAQLDDIQRMGFDVLYMPPIHPIGREFRKGKNNTLEAGPEDVGSPWAIGAKEGGHDAIHPALGTFADFDALVKEANRRGIELALDLALQCAPDHPWVKQHPEWFKHRPDGTIQYAENPPKKYQDIYPFDFESEHWPQLWQAILDVVLGWVARGVRIFRVDNPHTKPFPMWQWLIAEVKRRDAGVLFLAEAFTRPKVMKRLAKLGFTQSYTYFAWRNGPWDLREYFEELTQTEAVEFYRPNAWPNTPDILTEYLQHGGRGAFIVRAVLAATLCASWGVYGPAYELMEHEAVKPGSEEYLDSEKYQLRAWETSRADSLAPLLGRLNRIRRDHPALQQDRTLRFHPCDNPAIVCYSKTSGDDAIVVAANTDPHRVQWGTVRLDLAGLRIEEGLPYQMKDLLTDAHYRWQGPSNVVGLDPSQGPVHVFQVRRHQRTEAEVEYFL